MPVARRLLAGLQAYTLADSQPPPPSTPTHVAFATQGAAGTLPATFPVQQLALQVRPHYRLYTSALHSALLCLLALPLAETTGAHTTVLPLLALLTAGHAVRGLLVSLADGRVTTPREQKVSIAAGVCGCALALVVELGGLLGGGPDPLRLRAAGLALAPTLAHLRSTNTYDGAAEGWRTTQGGNAAFVALAIPLALLSGLSAGVVFLPATRWAKAYWLATCPPPGVAALTTPPAAHTSLLRLSFVLTAACAALPYFAAQAFSSSSLIAHAAASDGALLPLALIAAATSPLLTCRGAAQSSLDGALVAWYQLRHVTGVDASLAVQVMTAKFGKASSNLCHAAMLHTGPAQLLLAAGTVMLAKRPGVTMDAARGGGHSVFAPEVYVAAAGFLGAWTALVWTATAFVQLFALRQGLARVG